MTTADMPNSDQNDTALDDHPSPVTIARYVAALLADAADDAPGWDKETRHLQVCEACQNVAIGQAGELLWESPAFRLLEPGEFARHAQAVWVSRLQDDRAPMREAAAKQLAALTPLSPGGFAALFHAAMGDSDIDVRAAATAALREALDHETLATHLQLARTQS